MFKNFNTNSIFTVIDFGTNKTVIINYLKNSKEKLKIINWNHKKSVGFNRGEITDQLKFSKMLNELLSNIKMPKTNEVVVSIADNRTITKKNYVEIDVSGLSINKKDIRNVVKKNIQLLTTTNWVLLHSFPKQFFIDEKIPISNPLGKSSKKIGLKSNNFLIRKNCLKQIKSAFPISKKILPTQFIDSGLASAISCLGPRERENGSISIDFGAGSVKIISFYRNNLEMIKYIQLGGNDVTNDIAKIFEISYERAEYIKTVYGSLNQTHKQNIKIELPNGQQKNISTIFLHGIIKPRYEEILEMTRDNLEDNIFSKIKTKSMIFTGGGCQIQGFESFCSKIFNKKIMIAYPLSVNSNFKKPEFSTVDGLMKIHEDKNLKKILSTKSWNKKQNFFEKVETWVNESLA